jgi:hypothetical protein
LIRGGQGIVLHSGELEVITVPAQLPFHRGQELPVKGVGGKGLEGMDQEADVLCAA